MKPLLLSHFTATSCAGRGLDATLASLRGTRSGLVRCAVPRAELDTWIGTVQGVDDEPVRADLADYDCRNNRLAQLGLRQDGFAQQVEAARARHGAARIGVFIGTSTAGMLETETAYRERDPVSGQLPGGFRYAQAHNLYSTAAFVRVYFDLRGPAFTISSACSSSAKVFGSARRMLDAGLIDAALVGGVDTLCLTTLYGFNSLELLSRERCMPFDRARSGLSIGEAAAFALLEPHDARTAYERDAILLLGVGESSDAHHMSSPHPDGLGARLALEQALATAGVGAAQVDYVNLHGTATPGNDASEGKAVNAVFGPATRCSSTKGATGHALGAAGALEAVITALALRHRFVPAGVNTTHPDPALGVHYVLDDTDAPLSLAVSNSFGFGGTNCSLLLGRAERAQVSRIRA